MSFSRKVQRYRLRKSGLLGGGHGKFKFEDWEKPPKKLNEKYKIISQKILKRIHIKKEREIINEKTKEKHIKG